MHVSPHHPKVVQLAEQLGRAQRLGQEGKNEEALALCTRLLADADTWGVVSAELLWTAGVVCDQKGDFTMALDFTRRAVEADPLDPTLRNSYAIVIRHLREALLDEDRKVDDCEIPGLYGLLADVNGADEECRVRFGAYLVAVGKKGEARALLNAVVKLHPRSLDGWTLLAQVAEPGDLELLRGTAPTANELCGPQSGFFPQPGPAQS